MGKPKPAPTLEIVVSGILRRLGVLERRSRDVLTPVSFAGAVTVTSTTFIATHTCYVNPVGPQVTWWVRVTLSGGATSAELQLQDLVGHIGPLTTVTATGVAKVVFPAPDDWTVGTDRQIELNTRVLPAGTLAVMPLRAIVA
jgi:hypothetical protein